MALLSDQAWKAKYDSDGASLLREFYEPALSAAVRYDRTTGYFSAGVLTLASRGVEALARAGGRMRLVVGCTLSQAEADAIARGESLKDRVEAQLGAMPLAPGSSREEAALELLSYMIARGYLEVRVAIPCDGARRPVASQGLFHEKAGIIEDKTGDRLAFNGSVNETPQGWAGNWESFHAFTSWTGEDGRRRVDAEEDSFARLWANKARHCVVIDVPTAVREDLLKFLPPDDQAPRRLLAGVEPLAPSEPPSPPEPSGKAALPAAPRVDTRRLVWGLIQNATQFHGGELVGEAGSVVTPWPHQIRAFERVYGSWPPRLLIADEVGLGKTIEAGLILRQAWLAGRAKRVLVLAPKAVLTQWQIELREKFNLDWPIYDGQKLSWYGTFARGAEVERKVSRAEWHLEPFVLTSSQLMRRVDRAGELLEQAAPWDLVVLDEAHHARRKGGGTGKDQKPNQLLTLMQALRPKTSGLLLMTATPMQVSPVEVWDLLNLLGLPAAWDVKSFEQFFEKAAAPNPSHADFEFLARMFRECEAHFGETTAEAVTRFVPGGSGLATRKILRALRDNVGVERKRLESDRRQAALRIMQACSPVRRLISRHTRDLLRRYFQAGKISTPIPTRAVEDRFVKLSAAEREVYERVEDYISTTYDQARPDQKNAVGFVMTIYRRRFASSFEALAQTLSGRIERVEDQEAGQRLDDDVSGDEARDDPIDTDEARQLEFKALQAEELADIAALLSAVRTLPPDTKLGHLLDVLKGLKAAGHKQTLVFTQYTDTLDFLRDQLVSAGWRVMCFSGRGGEVLGRDSYWRTISRDDAKRVFREGQADILLCTDAAAEGLNFQFCGSLVNYDMPWNPMRVEQRIGRIDRLGQKFPEIRIVNLHYEATVETDVYIALRERIGLFTKFVGKLQPILASLPRSIATAALARREDRDRVRDDLLSRLKGDVRTAEEAGFDLDAILESDLEEPERPEPPYSLADLEVVLNRPDLLPPGVSVRPLEPGQYEYRAPGLPPLRVTTRAPLFDEHPGSLELWSPGSPTFPADVDAAPLEEVHAKATTLRALLR